MYYLHNKWAQERSHGFFLFFFDAHALDVHTKMQARTHAFTHAHGKDNHNGPLHTWPVYKNCAPQHACIHWGQGYSLEEESTVGQHVTMYNKNETKQGRLLGLSCLRDKCFRIIKMGKYIVIILQFIWCFFSSCLTRIKPFSTCCWYILTACHGNLMKNNNSVLLPHGSVVVVQLVYVICVGVSVLLLPHGILVHWSVGLGGCVEGRRDTVTGLAAVVAVPVVHGAVWILVCSHKHNGRRDNDWSELWPQLSHINSFIGYCIVTVILYLYLKIIEMVLMF